MNGEPNEYTLEKLRIHERLAKIETQNNQLMELVERINLSLHGNGKEGLVVRFDRIEQHDKNEKAVFGILLLAVIGLVGRAVYDLFLFMLKK